MRNWRMKKAPRRRNLRSKVARRPTVKAVRTIVKNTLRKQMETKVINAQDNSNLPYGALGGVQMLAADVFSVKQGPQNSTASGALNRIGDKIRGVGFLMDYYFTIPTYYNIGATSYWLPYVKLRVLVFQTANYIPPLSSSLLFDTNFLPGSTSTLQPINYGGGFVKRVLYDKTMVIRNNNSVMGNPSSITQSPVGQVIHWKKYIPYKNIINFSDNSTTQPNATDGPIYFAISAEVDDANAGLVPSGTKIVFSTGYTKAWFKDYD